MEELDRGAASQRTAWSPGQRLLTAGLVFMVTAVAFEGLAVPTVMPATLDDLGGLALYGWAFSGYWLSNLVGITLAGMEADRRGPLLPFIVGTACFALGLVVAGLAPSMEWVVAGRIIQGLGGGAMGSIIYVAIARGYATSAQPRMIAVISSGWVIPGLVGPAVAGYVTQATSWRWAFLGLAPLLPLAALAVARPMARLGVAAPAPGSASGPGGARVRDAFQLALGAAVLLAALSAPNLLIGVPITALGLLLIAAPLRRLLPAGTLRARPGPASAVAVLALVSASFLGAEAFVPLAVASVRGAGTIAGGVSLTAAAVTWATGAWIQARLAPRHSRRTLCRVGIELVLLGIGLVTLVPLTGVPAVATAAVAWAIAGLGMGLAYSTATLVIIETAPEGGEGAASAAAQLANTLGIAFGTGLAGGVVSISAASWLGLAPGIAVANVLLVVAGIIGLVITRRMPDRPPERMAPVVAAPDRGPAL